MRRAYYSTQEKLNAFQQKEDDDRKKKDAKVVFDQTIVAPPFMAGFLSYMTLAEGRTLADVRTRVTQQLRPLILDSWTVWMPAHCVTFNLPVPVRLLWQDCVRLYFGTIMSMRSNRRLVSEC